MFVITSHRFVDCSSVSVTCFLVHSAAVARTEHTEQLEKIPTAPKARDLETGGQYIQHLVKAEFSWADGYVPSSSISVEGTKIFSGSLVYQATNPIHRVYAYVTSFTCCVSFLR